MAKDVNGNEVVPPRYVVRRGDKWIYERDIPASCREHELEATFRLTLSEHGNDPQEALDAKAKTASDMYRRLIDSALHRWANISGGDETTGCPSHKPKRDEGQALAATRFSQVEKALKSLRKFLQSDDAPRLLSKPDLETQSSSTYSRNFAECMVDDRRIVLEKLEREGLIEIGERGKITNLYAEPLFSGASSKPKIMYLISNPAMPGWVKNGQSTRTAEQRAGDMKTDAPREYVVEKSYQLPAGMSDTDFHPYMKKVAGEKEREWFFMPQEVAEQVIEAVMDGNEHLIDEMPKCEPPSVLATVRNSFSDLFRARARQQEEVL